MGTGEARHPWAAALGPGAYEVVEKPAATIRTAGFAPRVAEQAISLSGSFAFGVRLDGVDQGGFERRLPAWGVEGVTVGAWTSYDLGDERSVPSALADAPFATLGARVATGPSAVVLARAGRTRENLIGAGERLSDQPLLHLAAGCLGDVATARILQAPHLVSRNLGVDLVAAGCPSPAAIRVARSSAS